MFISQNDINNKSNGLNVKTDTALTIVTNQPSN